MSWDPKQYLKYSNERLRPAQDLLARIALESPATIVDLGCGAGNVTALLGDRWPNAHVTGVDNSNEMLTKARATTAGDARFAWIEADLATWSPPAPADVVYSNAALHWQGGHARLFPRIFDWVAPGGTLAVQMPDNFAAPSHKAIAEVVASARWRDQLGALQRTSPVLPAADYFRLLGAAERVDAWTTEYLHVLPAATDDVHPVVAWVKGTTLTPFLAVLDTAAQKAFIADVSSRVAASYPALPDGRVLFPFRRVFVVAARSNRADRTIR
jgi:trans-aconitate 2-methyltransferase